MNNTIANGKVAVKCNGGSNIEAVTLFNNKPMNQTNPKIRQIENVNQISNSLIWHDASLDNYVESYIKAPEDEQFSYIKLGAADPEPYVTVVDNPANADYPAVIPKYTMSGTVKNLVDEGSGAYVSWTEDVEGNSREVDGDNDNASTVDIGATEMQITTPPSPSSIVVLHQSPTPCQTGTNHRYVPYQNSGDFQNLLDDPLVEDGVKIIVCPGTYYENLTIPAKLKSDVIIEGETDVDGNLLTTMDGSGWGRVIDHSSQPWSNFVLKNLNINNGYSPDNAAGIRVPWGSQSHGSTAGLKIDNCAFDGNVDDELFASGGAIFIEGNSDITITGSDFSENSGILYADYGSNIQIINSTLINNQSGIYMGPAGSLKIDDCDFMDNEFAIWGEAKNLDVSNGTIFRGNEMAIYINYANSNQTLKNTYFIENKFGVIHGSNISAAGCIFSDNGTKFEPLNYYLIMASQVQSGQTVEFSHCKFIQNFSERYILHIDAQTKVKNCLFGENILNQSGSYDVGVIKSNGLELINSTLYNNYGAADGSSAVYQLFSFSPLTGTNTINGSILFHDGINDGKVQSSDTSFTSAAYSIIKNWTHGGAGMQTAPPELVNTYPNRGDLNYSYKINSVSGINHGNPNYVPATGELDLEGLPRIYDDPDKSPDIIDIGAYELQKPPGNKITITISGEGYFYPYDPTGTGTKIIAYETNQIISVDKFTDLEILMTPHDKYYLEQIDIDGTVVPGNTLDNREPFKKIKYFRIPNITGNHSVNIDFRRITKNVRTITNLPAALQVYPGDNVDVPYWDDATFKFHVLPGFKITRITAAKLDGVSPSHILEEDEHTYPIKRIEHNYRIDVQIEECGTQPDLYPNYVTSISHPEPGVELKSFSVPNGFGKVIQTQSSVGVSNYNIVNGVYFNKSGQPTHVPMPFIDRDAGGSEFKFISMGCKELLVRANNYYDGGTDKPGENKVPTVDAGGFAYSETVYREEPGGSVLRTGSPGVNYSVSGHYPKSWTFAVPASENFLPLSTFVPDNSPEEYLDKLYEEQKTNNSNLKYVLTVSKDADDNYAQSISDKFGNVVNTWSAPNYSDTSKIDTSRTKYDVLGRPVETTVLDGSLKQRIDYNEAGQVTRNSTPDKNVVKFKYDKFGRIRFTQNEAQRSGYSEFIGRFTVYKYDALGRTVSVGINNNAALDFDKPDAQVASNIKTKTIYDQITSSQIEEMGVSDKIAKSILSELKNLYGRPVATVSYGENGEAVADISSYYPNGELKAVYTIIPGIPVQKMEYKYAQDGKMLQRKYYSDITLNKSGTGDYEWIEKSVKDISYNALQQLESISDNSKKFIQYTQNYFGDLQEKHFYKKNGASPIGVKYGKTIDGLTEISTLTSSAPAFRQDITYTASVAGVPHLYSGRVQSSQFTYDLTASPPRVKEKYAYKYDNKGQLTNVNKNDAPDYAVYDYGKAGRILKKQEGSFVLDPYVYKADKNQLHNAGSDKYHEEGNFAYDLNGNMVLDRSKNMTIDYDWNGNAVLFNFYDGIPDIPLTWDMVERNGLEKKHGKTRVAKVEMLYDAGGNRVRKCEEKLGPPVTYKVTAYVGNLAVFTNTSPSDKTSMELAHINYVTPGGVTGKRKEVGTATKEFFYLKDNLGSARMVYNASDNAEEEANVFDAYGDVNYNVMPPAGEHVKELFTGKELDLEGDTHPNRMKLYYFGARFFDPELGVWLTTDPAGQFFNPYGYGDPINTIDPNGLWKIGLGISIGWTRKGGFSLGLGLGVEDLNLGKVKINTYAGGDYNFADGSTTYSAQVGGGACIGVCIQGGVGGSYNTESGYAINANAGVGLGTFQSGGGLEIGTNQYWTTGGDYIGGDVYGGAYADYAGFHARAGYSLGIGAVESGFYAGVSGYGASLNYHSESGFNWGASTEIAHIDYDSKTDKFSGHYVGQQVLEALLNLSKQAKVPKDPNLGKTRKWKGLFGTNYCGPGGSGGITGPVDQACADHDARYPQGVAGTSGALTSTIPEVIAADWVLAGSALLHSYSNPVAGILVGASFTGIASYKTYLTSNYQRRGLGGVRLY